MIQKYEASKKPVLSLMREKRKQAIVVSPVKSKSAHKFGAKSYASHIDLTVEQEEGEHVPDQFQTQKSVYCQNLNTQVDENQLSAEEEEGEKSDDSDNCWDADQYDLVHAEEMIKKEEEEFKQIMAESKRRRDDPLLHYEGDTDVEDIFVTQDHETDQDCVEKPVKKKVKRQGPTLRSHSQVDIPKNKDWVPSDDEKEAGFIEEEDDDGFEPLPYIKPKGRKSRAKKAKERVWYDENRENAEQQFMKFLCFRDVYQFWEALARLHIAQQRNFAYHRNCKDRIIVWCKERENYGCQFNMTALAIGTEKTFCVRKIHLEHICPTSPNSTRVNTKWLSKAYVDKYRTEPNTGISTIIDMAKKDFGVIVHKRMAYRAKIQARNKVLGDHKKQY